jgi:polysaccharide pyruvyl transferase WcaK-like protein
MFAGLRESAGGQGKQVYVSVTRSGATTAQGVVDLFDRLRLAGLEPVMFSSCESEDRPLIDSVLALSEEKVVAPVSWKASVRLFANAACVITNRLHCLIFSALAGAAVVPIANRQKALAYAEDAGLDYAPAEIADITAKGILDYLRTLDEVRDRQRLFLEASAETTQAAIDKVLLKSS